MGNITPASEMYYYVYATIDLDTGECLGIRTRSYETINPALIRVDVESDEFIGKFYNQSNGQWYEDAGFTIPWTTPTA